MNIFIIGSGTFGTAIANELSRNKNNKVVIFSRSKEKKDEINHFHTNKKYFPDKILNDSLVSTNEYSDVQNADIIFLALPSSTIIENIKYFSNYITSQQIVVNLSKGILSNGQTIIEFLFNPSIWTKDEENSTFFLLIMDICVMQNVTKSL